MVLPPHLKQNETGTNARSLLSQLRNTFEDRGFPSAGRIRLASLRLCKRHRSDGSRTAWPSADGTHYDGGGKAAWKSGAADDGRRETGFGRNRSEGCGFRSTETSP